MKKNENNKNKVSRCKLGDYCLKRMLYWLGIGFQLNLCDGQMTTHVSQCFLHQTFLTCSFLRVSKHQPVSPIQHQSQNTIRKKEHVRNVKTCGNASNIAKHAWSSFDHRIDFDNSSVIDKGSFRVRKTLEAWHTSATKHADNKALFTSRQGNPSARVTLARGLPWHSHISSYFRRRVYKAARVTLALG